MRLPAQFGNLYSVKSIQATCLHCNYCFTGRMRRAQIKIAIKHWSGRIFSSTRSFSKVVFEKCFKTLFRKTKNLVLFRYQFAGKFSKRFLNEYFGFGNAFFCFKHNENMFRNITKTFGANVFFFQFCIL